MLGNVHTWYVIRIYFDWYVIKVHNYVRNVALWKFIYF